ncbi:MAG: hypothetical protein IIY49_05645 [Eubacterium sp.]|nr:hypothetical protein [Eubacterium sp.]
MKKKKFIIGIIVFIIIVAALGSKGKKNNDKKSIVDSSNTSDNDSSDTKKTSSKVTIEEQVLVDQDGVKITAKEFTTGGIMGDGIKVVIENNTSENITVGCTALIVNDYMINDLFASDVAAGKKSNETIDLYTSELNAAGIDTVGKIEIYFHVYKSEGFDKLFDSECITIKTSEYDNMDTTADIQGKELYNEGGIKIVGKAVDENSFWGTAILLYVENNSGRNVGINVDNMSVNGYMMNPIFSTTVYDGKKDYDDITLLKSQLEENGITSINDVELTFHIYDADTYETITDSDTIKFSAE